VNHHALAAIMRVAAQAAQDVRDKVAVVKTLFRREVKEPKFQTWLKRTYLGLLGRITKSPNVVIVAVLLVCAAAALKLLWPEVYSGTLASHRS
jgi:hypothetical protein